MTRGRHNWLVPLVLALVVGGVGWWADRELSRAIQRGLRDDLQSTLNANVTALEIWMENQKRMAASLADEPHLKTAALTLFDQPADSRSSRTQLGELSSELLTDEHLQERVRSLGYDMVQLVSTNLSVVSDMGRRRSRSGNRVMEELQPKYAELFARGEPILITPFKPPELRPRPGNGPRPPSGSFGPRGTNNPPPPSRAAIFMQVAAPIKDPAGRTRGALALGINPNAEFTRILSVSSSGDSGETLAFDAEGLLISKSRFDEELKRLKLLPDETNAMSALTLSLRDPGGDLTGGFVASTNTTHPLMLMVEKAIQGESGVTLSAFRDYRGVPVIGAWRWLPQYGFGVGTKMDAREAFQPLRVVRRVFLILFLLLVLASVIILLFTILQVTWRRRLTEAELKARQLGQYRLLEQIGVGGMGVVYKAHHALLRRETAIKLLLPDAADPAAIARFEQEVRLTCRLTHPNTIQVYDYGRTPDGIFYYAMEYLDGLNLHELVQRYGALPEDRVGHILQHICESLAEAHGVGLIHRDIKPANVFLCDRGGVADCVKVLDFGLVKRISDRPDASKVPEGPEEDGIVGTPNFIAPETIRDGHHSDARSDLYSLGALGYFLLTGFEVFDPDSIAELCRKHLTETPLSPGARAGKAFTPQLETLLMGCLEKEPAARPQSARDLGQAIAGLGLADSWTVERRAFWWATHRRTSAEKVEPAERFKSAPAEKTVKIAFENRTP